MELVLITLGVGFILELFVHAEFIWYRYALQIIACLAALVCIIFASVALVVGFLNIFTALIGLISFYRAINLLRIIEGRMNLHYMYNVTLRTSVLFGLCQAIVLVVWFLLAERPVSANFWLGLVALFQIIAGGVAAISTFRTLKHTQAKNEDNNVASSELPSISVAIPARNETDDLYECLQTLVKTNYPKLEILVLDDCSQLKRTPEIIRSFAHAGVRFVQGDLPRDGWLAKNYAYEQLLHEASGEIILFCGVDTRFEPDTIRQMILAMKARHKKMMCVLPIRQSLNRWHIPLAQAARYFWELAPPRRLFNRPPVLSSFWAIYRQDIVKLGGFGAVSRAILPEAYFAKQLLSKDGYSFIRANEYLSVYSAKGSAEQRQTAIRTRYPQLHKRPETVLMVTITGFVCFISPYVVLAFALAGNISFAWIITAVINIVLCSVAYIAIAIKTKICSWHVALIGFLPTICTDFMYIHYSLYKYEFSDIQWKGRNVCLPVMHVMPHLPKV